MLIHGKCHCGNISFSLTWEPDPAEIQARACTCSFCTKHGGVWTSNSSGALQVVVKNSALVSKYAFGTETADAGLSGAQHGFRPQGYEPLGNLPEASLTCEWLAFPWLSPCKRRSQLTRRAPHPPK